VRTKYCCFVEQRRVPSRTIDTVRLAHVMFQIIARFVDDLSMEASWAHPEVHQLPS
jgi:hypothetical protein